jgi:hypothetical protein
MHLLCLFDVKGNIHYLLKTVNQTFCLKIFGTIMATYPSRKIKFVVRQDFELSPNVLDDGHVTINMNVILIIANCH